VSPLQFVPHNNQPSFYGNAWNVADYNLLVDLTARLALGHYRHVAKILSGSPAVAQAPTSASALVLKHLGPVADEGHRSLRDGWVFQLISWVAAHIGSTGVPLVITIPHSQPAEKGCDAIILSNLSSTPAITICEDKATDNPRKTITSKVWPELRKFESGERDHEIAAEVTALAERFAPGHADQLITTGFWRNDKRYRISIATSNSPTLAASAIFDGYETKVAGDIIRRQAELFLPIGTNLRAWMDAFCSAVCVKVQTL